MTNAQKTNLRVARARVNHLHETLSKEISETKDDTLLREVTILKLEQNLFAVLELIDEVL